MITRRRFLALCGAAGGTAVVAVASARLLPSDRARNEGPPAIRYGAEACAACGMVIDDARFAAAWTSPHTSRHYDDIGCMVTDLLKHPAPQDARMYVHDIESEAWLPASDATYLLSSAIRTPMAYGIAATATREAADRLSARYQARVQAWAALAAARTNGRG